MEINIHWEPVEVGDEGDEGDDLWDQSRVLYAYVDEGELLYLGKAWSTTVRRRWLASDKDNALQWLYDNNIYEEDIEVLVGVVEFPTRSRLTRELLADLESLLIYRERPSANVKNTRTRAISRPGLVVTCSGDWPGQAYYRDTGPT